MSQTAPDKRNSSRNQNSRATEHTPGRLRRPIREIRELFRLPQFWILFAFALSRVLYYAAGVRFDARPIDHFFQFLDPELLKHRLLESLLYLHVQPPGFNLYVALILKLFPAHYAEAFHVVHLTLGA